MPEARQLFAGTSEGLAAQRDTERFARFAFHKIFEYRTHNSYAESRRTLRSRREVSRLKSPWIKLRRRWNLPRARTITLAWTRYVLFPPQKLTLTFHRCPLAWPHHCRTWTQCHCSSQWHRHTTFKQYHPNGLCQRIKTGSFHQHSPCKWCLKDRQCLHFGRDVQRRKDDSSDLGSICLSGCRMVTIKSWLTRKTVYLWKNKCEMQLRLAQLTSSKDF